MTHSSLNSAHKIQHPLSITLNVHLQPHADAALFPSGISRIEAYEIAEQQLQSLFEGQRSWIVNLSNAASLVWALFHSRPVPEPLRQVNWAGFYLRSDLYPRSRISIATNEPSTEAASHSSVSLLLGPFAGLPACQSIAVPHDSAEAERWPPGVCAAAYFENQTQLVPDVEKRPGHIACDANTKSELVVPLRTRIANGDGKAGEEVVVGVLDIDCEVENGFDKVDRERLERIASLIGKACDW